MLSKKVILTLLAAIIACSILGFCFFKPNVEDLKKQMFTYKVHGKKRYELVVAGDSRTYRGVSANIIGKRLNKTAINLGFSSGGFSEKMFDLIENKLQNKKGNIIVLGVSPLTLTDMAAENGHIERLLELRQEEVIAYLYLNKLLNIFAPTTPRYLWNSVFNKASNIDNYLQEVNIREGWVKSDYLIPNQHEALPSYKHTFARTKISDRVILEFYHQIQKWTTDGYLVFGFTPPSSANIEELERQYSDFNDSDFVNGFAKAGGKWIPFEETYISYDGSHLDSKSAIKLSKEIASAIANKTYFSGLLDSNRIKTNYYQFNSKYTFQNDFENDTNNAWKTDIAYSGNQVLESNHNTKYLGLYYAKANDFIDNNIKTVLVDIQAYYEKENSSAMLVVEINQDGQNILWSGVEITDIVKPSDWGRVRLEVSIPNNISFEDEFKVYIFNKNKSKILIDNFKIDMY